MLDVIFTDSTAKQASFQSSPAWLATVDGKEDR